MSDLDLLAERQRASEQAALASKDSAPDPVDTSVQLDPIRKQALTLALQHNAMETDRQPSTVVATAKAFEQYLRGSDA